MPTRESATDVLEVVGEFDRLASQQRSRASTQGADTLDPVVQATAPVPATQFSPQIENGKITSPIGSPTTSTDGATSPTNGAAEAQPQKEPSIDENKQGVEKKRNPSVEVADDGKKVTGTVTDLVSR